ncbi:MAG: hypothetical protein L0Z50_36190 [Verrucomicrobiales bacterium]|nr:hypothetical protein [Verrucomicrobiales bacterium]
MAIGLRTFAFPESIGSVAGDSRRRAAERAGPATAKAGRAFNSDGAEIVVARVEERQHRQRVATRTDTDFFTRVAKWVEADPGTRSISPFSRITTEQYVNRRIQDNTVTSLREAIQLSPGNDVAFARLAALVKNEESKDNAAHLEEAEFYARRALKQNPRNREAGQTLEEIRSLKTQPARETSKQ